MIVAMTEVQAAFAIGHVVTAVVLSLHALRAVAQQDLSADVLPGMAEADTTLRIPIAVEPAGVQHALGAAAVVVVVTLIQPLLTLALAKREPGHAGLADPAVAADQPTVQLEADAVETDACHVATDAEVVRPHAEAGALVEQVVEAIRQRAAGCIDGPEGHRRAVRVQLAGQALQRGLRS
jgi:hypothetical protein